MTFEFHGVWWADRLTRVKTTGRTYRTIVRYSTLSVCVVLVLLALAACSNTDENLDDVVHDNLKVKNLEIVDDEGNTRAVFTTISGGRPSLTLLDGEGELRAWLTLNDDGSPNLLLLDQGRIVLMDGTGGIRSTYSLDETNNPSVQLFSESSELRSFMGLNESGAAVSELFDESGQVIWSAP
jgi:hypothetical protein